ncbi:MAG: type I methionyl aminopeptidase [Candidatus Omnitrophica bacterium]|nr:type I methionyl aminopeptidase [Candidatus Omnitrophota bacterium]MBU1128451.1 type I methionyl aminopeptidase [Candidatus Omnitrophota bacterium]MBU1656606.1 type I methionyl aminopeptidase [Candidatus Omnitrophota bacterium]MBU1851644.1 type I methionyl aminopeptidase [Candidatus Omnitrophota bacterium]
MTIITSKSEIRKIRDSGKVIKDIFVWLENAICAGVATGELDRKIETIIRKSGGSPAFKGYKGFPATICASINNVVVHGIPSDKNVLKDGDIISVDVGVRKNGYFTDAARTFGVGDLSDEARDLIRVTKKCLAEGVRFAVAGNRVSDISNAIEKDVRKSAYKEVRSFVGHGVGKDLHEPPEVPNWGRKGEGPVLKEGLILAIEPMVNVGVREVKVMKDGWTAVTEDGKLSAHFEDTIIVGKERAETLT